LGDKREKRSVENGGISPRSETVTKQTIQPRSSEATGARGALLEKIKPGRQGGNLGAKICDSRGARGKTSTARGGWTEASNIHFKKGCQAAGK